MRAETVPVQSGFRPGRLPTSASRKRILLVTDLPFWKGGAGGHVRIRSLCRELSGHCLLTVFYLGEGNISHPWFQQAGARIQITAARDHLAREWELLQPSGPGKPRLAENLQQRQMLNALGAYFAEQPAFEAVIVEQLQNAYLASVIPQGPVAMIDMHQFVSLSDYGFSRDHLNPGFSVSLAHEQALLARFGVIISIQPQEAEAFKKLAKQAVVLCCPHALNVMDPGIPKAPKAASRELVIGFVGSDSVANVRAVKWFLSQVWPLFAARSLRLNLYGSVNRGLTQVPGGVSQRDFVADVASLYAECDAMINPAFEGGGLKIKSLEALAYGKPLLTTPEGAQGICTSSDSGMLIARNRDEFVNFLLLLLARRELVQTLGASARMTAARFSPAKAYSPLIGFIREM